MTSQKLCSVDYVATPVGVSLQLRGEMDSPCVLVASSTDYDPRELVKRKLHTCINVSDFIGRLKQCIKSILKGTVYLQ